MKRDEMSKNISKMMREWKRTGKITTSRAVYRPKTKKDALRQILRIEYEKARKKKPKLKNYL